MLYTIHGFQQELLVEYGCDAVDALFLRWFADFIHTGKMETLIEDEKVYYWINHQYVLTQNPIMKIKSTESFSRRLRRMEKKELLFSQEKKLQGKTKKFYRFNPEVYERLTFHTRLKSRVQEQPENGQVVSHPTQKSPVHPTQKSPNSSIKEIISSKDNKEREKEKPKVENELSGKATHAKSPQEEIYCEVFGEQNFAKLTILQQQQLTILDDLELLRKTCQWWAGNNYKPNSIGRLCERYHEQEQKAREEKSKPRIGQQESVFDRNLRFLGIDPATLTTLQ